VKGVPVRCARCDVEWIPAPGVDVEPCWQCGRAVSVVESSVAPRTTLGRGLPDHALTGGEAA
jgi:hypothetical protein